MSKGTYIIAGHSHALYLVADLESEGFTVTMTQHPRDAAEHKGAARSHYIVVADKPGRVSFFGSVALFRIWLDVVGRS